LNLNCAEPNFVRVWLPKIDEQTWVRFDIQIRDDNHEPLYRVIKHNGADCDVAIFELNVNTDEYSKYFWPSINHQTFRNSPLKASSNWVGDEIGSQLLITGFPQQRVNQKLAVTIPAYVATEPRVDYEVTNQSPSASWPFFLVSARTWKGQSGSPVYINASSGLTLTQDSWMYCSGASTNIVGIYTGRLIPHGAGADSSDLGIVWHIDLLKSEVALSASQ
jgi:hypothetical protein